MKGSIAKPRAERERAIVAIKQAALEKLTGEDLLRLSDESHGANTAAIRSYENALRAALDGAKREGRTLKASDIASLQEKWLPRGGTYLDWLMNYLQKMIERALQQGSSPGTITPAQTAPAPDIDLVDGKLN